jgi:hypothetical protein
VLDAGRCHGDVAIEARQLVEILGRLLESLVLLQPSDQFGSRIALVVPLPESDAAEASVT